MENENKQNPTTNEGGIDTTNVGGVNTDNNAGGMNNGANGNDALFQKLDEILLNS